jgi:hypothetical protein
MRWISTDDEVPEERAVTERRTLKELRKCTYVAIQRWLVSGVDCPDEEATDGISEEQAVMEDGLPASEKGWHS